MTSGGSPPRPLPSFRDRSNARRRWTWSRRAISTALGGKIVSRCIDVEDARLDAVGGEPDHHRCPDVLRTEKIIIEFRADDLLTRPEVIMEPDIRPPLTDIAPQVALDHKWIALPEVLDIALGYHRIDARDDAAARAIGNAQP